MSVSDPTTFLAPGQPFIVDGLDWSWAFVIHREIRGFEGYAVGSDGSFWSRHRRGYGFGLHEWRRISPFIRREKYPNITLYDRGAQRTLLAHRVILEAFRGPCPKGMEACHFPDPDPANLALRNLRWGSKAENYDDQRVHGTNVVGSKVGTARLTDDGVREVWRLRATGLSQQVIADKTGVHQTIVSKILRGKSWKHVESEWKQAASVVNNRSRLKSSTVAPN